MICWTLDAVRGVAGICDVVISTDDEMIAKVCEDYGFSVPWLRPPELSTDEAGSVDVVLHALDQYGSDVDGVMLLQPTSPFRSSKSIREAIDIFEKSTAAQVVSVSKVKQHPEWMMVRHGEYIVPMMQDRMLTRSQDMPDRYVLNGSIYLIAPDALRRQRAFVKSFCSPVVIENEMQALDIDTESDFKLAEYYATNESHT